MYLIIPLEYSADIPCSALYKQRRTLLGFAGCFLRQPLSEQFRKSVVPLIGKRHDYMHVVHFPSPSDSILISLYRNGLTGFIFFKNAFLYQSPDRPVHLCHTFVEVGIVTLPYSFIVIMSRSIMWLIYWLYIIYSSLTV